MNPNKGIISDFAPDGDPSNSSVPLVVLKGEKPGQPSPIGGQPDVWAGKQGNENEKNDHVNFTGDSSVVLLSVDEAAELTGRTRQGILKVIAAGKVDVERVPSTAANRKGKEEYRIVPDSLFGRYPDAKAAWDTRQAEARRAHEAQVIRIPTSPYKRDEHQVVLRARPEAMTNAQKVRNARLNFLEVAVRSQLQILSEYERKKARGGLPKWLLAQAVAWLTASEDGQAILDQLGKIPSGDTVGRWWKGLCADPTGMNLQPKSYAAGRERLTDKDPALMNEILGAWYVAKSFRGTADLLQQQGYSISENTIRRAMAEVPQSILAAPQKGAKKALHDYGPYVRRKPSLPFQCWSIDGHTFDAEILWEDPKPGEKLATFRPYLYVVRDVGSGAILGCQVGKELNRYLALQAIAEAILRCGIIPETIQPDNGSEVVNRLFEGDQDIIGYWDQLGMDWKDGQALVHHALPYNSRSKPIERDFRDFTEGFAARFAAYVGNSPSTRPGTPLAEARAMGKLETMATFQALLNTFLDERNQKDRTIQRHRINPMRALQEQREVLIKELGADHPRFVRPGQGWKVLPGLKARKVREAICCRIEGREFRYHTPSLYGMEVEGLRVRIWPWDMNQAWLVRGSELIDVLEPMPDASELGASERDLTSLRITKNMNKVLRGTIHKAIKKADEIRNHAQMRGIRLSETGIPSLVSKPKPEVIDAAELKLQRDAFATEEAKKAKKPLETNAERYHRLLMHTPAEGISQEDHDWITDFEKTSEGKSLREVLEPYRRDRAAR